MGRCFHKVALAMLLAVTAGSTAQATGLGDYLDGTQSLSIADSRVMADLATYYRLHANVRLESERRLKNGVAWRVLSDVRTGVRTPRLTWMADRAAMLKANALFDVAHGAALVDFEKIDVRRRHAELYDWEFGQPPWVIKPPYFYAERVELTYATPRLVSYIEVRREVRENSMGIELYGRVLDLARGRIREIEGCEPPRYSYGGENFRFGELLDVCRDDAYQAFMTLWASKVRQAIAAARARGDELSAQCGESMGSLGLEGRGLALYLTPAGVAVFNGYWIPNSAKYCALYDDITVNPVILSYRELEPFMKPGPWRDELLAPSSSTPRPSTPRPSTPRPSTPRP